MRRIVNNTDGSIEIIGSRPIKIIRNSDGVEFNIVGRRKRQGRTTLYGNGVEFDVGVEHFDPADMEPDSIPGHTCIFRSDSDLISNNPPRAERFSSVRKTTKQEIIDAGLGFTDERGRFRHDHTYRGAWKDTGKIEVDMPKAREIHMERIRAVRNAKLDETDRQVSALDGGPIPQALKAMRQNLRDIPQTIDLEKAKTVEELKALWPAELI